MNIFSAIAAFFLTILIFLRRKMNPEKAIRKNLQKTTPQGNMLGDWNIRFTASGISYTVAQKRNSSLPWSEFTLTAETEHAFYCIHKDNRRFIPVPKSCLSDYEQAQNWLQYCQTKGLTPVQVKPPKYMPAPLFYVLLAFVFCLFFVSGIWHGYRNSTPAVSGSSVSTDFPAAADSSITTDFPAAADSVPLEVQAETLRLLGLTVPDEAVDGLVQADGAQGDIFRNAIESFPYTYTWLLMSLGSPEYDENFEIIGYSEEVFWFDFESWDLETDYIHILEGMAALAKGSAVDGVENIRVDTAKVDWEKGRGTLTVLLDYNGKTLNYPMKVYNDWIDEDVLSIYNDLLQDTGSAECFYATGDGGQGAIIFFCSDEWAKNFEKATNIELEEL
ncbi:MAG: YcxB family protein [Clostridium sp.]|nr:YcxB family protein [Clostridium sp.]